MKKKYLMGLVLVLVLAGISIFVTRTNNLRMPVTLPEFRESQTQINDSGLVGAEPPALLKGGGGMPDLVETMPPYFGNDALSVSQRQYETYASYNVVVKDVASYLNQLRDGYLAMEGRVLSLSINTVGKYQNGYLSAKVPVASFDVATQQATTGVQKVVNQSQNTTDVTGIVVNLDEQIQQLENQRSQREVDLIEAKTDADKKRIQLDINRLQSQIDGLNKQKTNQQTQVQYATVTVSAASSEKVFNPSTRPDLWETLTLAFDSVINNLYTVAQFFIWAVVYAVVLLPAIWLISRLRRQKSIAN